MSTRRKKLPTRLPIIKRDGKICIQDYYVRHGREIALEYYYRAIHERNKISGLQRMYREGGREGGILNWGLRPLIILQIFYYAALPHNKIFAIVRIIIYYEICVNGVYTTAYVASKKRDMLY